MSEYENLPSSVWAIAWAKLYQCFGERMQQDELDLMDAVLSGVEVDMQDEIQRWSEAEREHSGLYPGKEILRRLPHLDRRE